MRALAILLIVPLLAGCADGGGYATDPGNPGGSGDPGGDDAWQATLVVDYGDMREGEPTRTVVAFDPSSRPTQDAYEDTGTPRPDAYTVHDLTVDWSRESGTPVTVEHHAATGYRVTDIDGVTANTTPGGRWYWSLHVDGEPAAGGMGTVAVADGSEVAWVFTHATD